MSPSGQYYGSWAGVGREYAKDYAKVFGTNHMNQLVVVLAVPHQLQGEGFVGFVPDPCYEDLLRSQIRNGVDFIFEEAAGRQPSVAGELIKQLVGPNRYWDVDPSPLERASYGIGTAGGGRPIDPPHSRDVLEWAYPEANRNREELWVKRVLAHEFRKGLAICGLCHALSFTLRLIDAGIHVEETFSYIPYCTICKGRH